MANVITVETRSRICRNCAAWFETTLWLYNRGSIVCPGCGCDPDCKGVTAEQRARVHCEDKDKEIARLARVIAGLRGVLNQRKPKRRREPRS